MNGQTYLELKKPVSEQEATYRAACELVAHIDTNLTRDVHHYRTKAGVLLTKLDEVVNAILTNNLMEPKNGNDNLYNQPDYNPVQPAASHLAMPSPASVVLPSVRGAGANHPVPGRKDRGAGRGERAAISASAISADGGRVGEGGQVGGVGE